MAPRSKAATGGAGTPSKRVDASGPGSVKPTRSSRKLTLSAKAAAGVDDGVKPAHVISMPKSRPLPSDVNERTGVESDSDSEAAVVSTRTKAPASAVNTAGSSGKRKKVVLSDASEPASPVLPNPSLKKKKTASVKSPATKRVVRVDVPVAPVMPPRIHKHSARAVAPAKKEPASDLEDDSDSEADAGYIGVGGHTALAEESDPVEYEMEYVDPNEPTLSDQDFIDDAPLEDDSDGQNVSVDSEAVAGLSDEVVEYGSDDNDGEGGVVSDECMEDDQEYNVDSDGASVPPTSEPPSPKKKKKTRVIVLDTEEEDEDSEVEFVDKSPPRSGARGASGQRTAPPRKTQTAPKGSTGTSKRPPSTPVRPAAGPNPSAPSPTKGSKKTPVQVSPSTPGRASASKPQSKSRPSSSTKVNSSGSVTKVDTSPVKLEKGKRKEVGSIKEQGALSPHKNNTSTGTCEVTNRNDMDPELIHTYRDLYPLKRAYIASAAGISVMLTPLSWLSDGTYGDKPINVGLLKDVITFAECEGLKFINPARFPPSRLGSLHANTTSSITYNLTTKELPTGSVSCITFGSVVDSHLFHPRVTVTSATHSITILPLHCEWERTLSCIGNALGERALSHFIYLNGVSFQGQWAKPTEEIQKAWEDEQAGSILPVYIPPKHPLAVSSVSSTTTPAPGQPRSSNRGLVGQGPPSIQYASKIPVFDCTRFFQPRRGDFATMTSLVDFFSQAGADLCPQITEGELRKQSFVAVCYGVNKWRKPDAPEHVPFGVGFNVRAVYLLINGPKA